MVTIQLDDEEQKVVRTSLQTYLLDITRKEYPIHRIIRGILAKLPPEPEHRKAAVKKAG